MLFKLNTMQTVTVAFASMIGAGNIKAVAEGSWMIAGLGDLMNAILTADKERSSVIKSYE